MRQVLVIVAVLCCGGLWVISGDEPKAPADGVLAKKFAAIQKKYDAEEKELKQKLANTKDPEEQKQLTFLTKELHALTANDAVELAEENRKDESARDAAVFALKLLAEVRVTGADMDKAIAIIVEHHLDSPKIQPALAPMAENGPTGLKFLQSVVEKATNKEVQALSMYYCALAMDAEAAEREAGMNEAGAAKLRGEAIEMMGKAVTLAPLAKVGEETLTKAAEVALISLKIGVGNAVPDVEGSDLDGKKIKLSSFKGKVVLFDYWATWCGPCVAMIPHERTLANRLANKPFALLSVSVDDDKATVTEFHEREKMPWNHWWEGPTGSNVKLFKVRSFPTLFLIDAKGVIRKKWLMDPGNDVLDKAVDELVAEAQKTKP